MASVLQNESANPEKIKPEILSEIIELTDTVLTDEAIANPEVLN